MLKLPAEAMPTCVSRRPYLLFPTPSPKLSMLLLTALIHTPTKAPKATLGVRRGVCGRWFFCGREFFWTFCGREFVCGREFFWTFCVREIFCGRVTFCGREIFCGREFFCGRGIFCGRWSGGVSESGRIFGRSWDFRYGRNGLSKRHRFRWDEICRGGRVGLGNAAEREGVEAITVRVRVNSTYLKRPLNPISRFHTCPELGRTEQGK